MKPARPKWSSLIVVCGECDGDTKGVRRRLRRAARQRFGRNTRVIRGSCLDVCPKRATCVTATGAGIARTVIVQDGDDTETVFDHVLQAGANAAPPGA